jgi:PAS domain-containing protein
MKLFSSNGEYPDRSFQVERAPGPTGAIEAPIERLDLATVIKVSQAASGEIVLEKLLEQELRLLVEAIPALVWRAGPEGNIEYVNKRVLEYLGAPLGEVMSYAGNWVTV